MDEYEQRSEASAAARLARILFKSGVLSETQLVDFLYPPMDAIEEAEERSIPV